MPCVNVKLVKQQITSESKQLLIDGIIDIIVNIMGRNKDLTVITLDEIDSSNWFIGNQPISNTDKLHGKLIYVEIKISKGTSNPEQMLEVIKAGRDLVNRVLGSSDITNYFVINELNPDSWGFDGISMTERNIQEQMK
ncbi:MAG: tautomerase family protein [Bacteroidales bacterium]